MREDEGGDGHEGGRLRGSPRGRGVLCDLARYDSTQSLVKCSFHRRLSVSRDRRQRKEGEEVKRRRTDREWLEHEVLNVGETKAVTDSHMAGSYIREGEDKTSSHSRGGQHVTDSHTGEEEDRDNSHTGEVEETSSRDTRKEENMSSSHSREEEDIARSHTRNGEDMASSNTLRQFGCLVDQLTEVFRHISTECDSPPCVRSLQCMLGSGEWR